MTEDIGGRSLGTQPDDRGSPIMYRLGFRARIATDERSG